MGKHSDKNKDSLRAKLRQATSDLHDRLDRQLGNLDLTNPVQYARFLRVQLAARRPIELWLAGRELDGIGLPPRQSGIIERDIMITGASPRLHSTKVKPFDVPGADRPDDAALGVAWVLAGSALGNRLMLLRLKRAMPVSTQPHAFLADNSMKDYWNLLRPHLERPRSPETERNAIEGAVAAFSLFLHIADGELAMVAA